MTKHDVIVVGGGVGGLTAAIDLARTGLSVLVVERAARVGGKMRQIDLGGSKVDSGPTVLTMRWVFDELFADAGASLAERVPMQQARVIARHAWADGTRLDLHADLDDSAAAIEAFSTPEDADGFRAFARYCRTIHDTVEGPFIRGQRPTMLGVARSYGLGGLSMFSTIDGYRTMWSSLERFFNDPRLVQLFGRYATYCGSSPFLAPATLNLIAHVEQAGVWYVDGGMYGLAQGLEALCRELGVEIRTGTDVAEIVVEGGRATGVRLDDGEVLTARAVACNAAADALYGGLLGQASRRAVPDPGERSLSALTWSMRCTTRGFPLTRHTVFFSDAYRDEFDHIASGALPHAPTVYACAQDRTDSGSEVSGAERLFLLVNAPATGDRSNPSLSEIEACETRTFAHLSRCGLDVEPQQSVRTSPAEFHRLFPGTGGALYGAASHGWRSPFTRPAARTRVPGLYLCGGTAHPGSGVPMVALSGRRLAEALVEDLASTSRSSRVATSGGTWTR